MLSERDTMLDVPSHAWLISNSRDIWCWERMQSLQNVNESLCYINRLAFQEDFWLLMKNQNKKNPDLKGKLFKWQFQCNGTDHFNATVKLPTVADVLRWNRSLSMQQRLLLNWKMHVRPRGRRISLVYQMSISCVSKERHPHHTLPHPTPVTGWLKPELYQLSRARIVPRERKQEKLQWPHAQ